MSIASLLDMRASDVAWAWVAQQVRDGRTVPGERVYRPEMGKLAGSEEQGLWIWKLVAQATTGWDVTVRQKISRVTLSRVVLSRQVLKSIYRVYDREMAKQWGVTIKEVQDMVLDPVMTPNLATMVWQNPNKQAGLVEGGGAGRKRFWACIHMLMEEGLVQGEVGTQDRDERWEGMTDEMMALQRLGSHWAQELWAPTEVTD